LDTVYRHVSGHGQMPPYSLRAFVGSSSVFEFDRAGKFFLDDFLNCGLLAPGARLLDIGCGCGRLAQAMASDPRVRDWNFSYLGFDVDKACISRCEENITRRTPRFRFRHYDV
jgi:2-polyprenyl-3-methyl-5-hydroxy-6-metoxy-1,4-benzoquinol methylase